MTLSVATSVWMPPLRLSTGFGFCLKIGSNTFRSVLIYGNEQERQKNFHNDDVDHANNFTFQRGFDHKNTFFFKYGEI